MWSRFTVCSSGVTRKLPGTFVAGFSGGGVVDIPSGHNKRPPVSNTWAVMIFDTQSHQAAILIERNKVEPARAVILTSDIFSATTTPTTDQATSARATVHSQERLHDKGILPERSSALPCFTTAQDRGSRQNVSLTARRAAFVFVG